jgi:hypothetical protein
VFPLVFFSSSRVVVITLQPLPPLPPYVRLSRATPNKVLSITSFSSGGAGASTLLDPPLCAVYFFRFGGGRPLHKVQFLILCSPKVHLAILFAISSPKVFLSSSSDALSILRRSSHLIPELLIRSLPRSCCLRPLSPMPLLHSGSFQILILDVRPYGVLGATLSWSYLLRPCSLRHATFARCIISLRATANSFRDSRLAWIRIFLMRFLFRHASFTRRDHFLQAAADFLLDRLFPRVLSLLFLRRSAARLQTLRCFLDPPTAINTASALGTY